MWAVLLLRLFGNAGVLFSGNVAAAALGLASLALTARGLGAEQFGTLVLVTAYVAIVDGLVNFQSWQAVIRFGAQALERQNKPDFHALVKFGSLLDFGTAALGAVSAAAAATIIARLQGWDAHVSQLAAIYSVTILFHVAGTPTAILRLFDRFALTAYQNVVAAVIKLVGVALVYVAGGGIVAYLVVWAVTDIAGKMLLVVMAWTELRRRGYSGIHRTKINAMSVRFPGIWSFVWLTNVNASLRLVSRELDIIIVYTFLGSAAVGMYKVAKQFARVIQKSVDPLYQAIYPDLAKLFAQKAMAELVQFATRAAAIAAAFALTVWAGFAVLGEPILLATVGSEYTAARGVMVWYMLAIVIAAAGFPLQPIMLSIGRPDTSFWIHLTTTLIYVICLVTLLPSVGLVGAGIAYVIYYATWCISMLGFEIVYITRISPSNAATAQ